ncbi:MAG TPA: hypothetical protein VFQ41_16525 [Candidatus Angelobacter sp.]|nr:hypothetical protein [Candidatus Angelobacter sp.]
MTVQHRIMSILSTLLVAAACSAPQLRAQQSNPSTAQQAQQPANTQPAQTDQAQPATQSPAPAQNTQAAPPAGQSQPANSGTAVNPSQAPLQPVTTYPDAAGAQQEQQSTERAPAQTTTIPEGPQPKKQSEPVGAATAESVPTTGGAAAKPAGVAIAPAKQHQTRSLLIKIGAVVAAGAALGTVYALSHGTSSTPPGTGLAGVTGR